MSFDSELAKGVFSIPQCSKCKKIVWPPLEFCSYCFGDVKAKKGDFQGKIIEFSGYGEQYFCIVEIETIRIIAKIPSMPKIGQSVKITKCGIKDGNYFFNVS